MYGVLSYYLDYILQFEVLTLTEFSYLSHCDLAIWHTDLKIQRVAGRGTANMPSKFHRNCLLNNIENIFSNVVSSWPWPLFHVSEIFTSRSLVKDYRRAKSVEERMINDREIAECAFSNSINLWPWPLTISPQNVYSLSTTCNFYTGQNMRKIWWNRLRN